jgi:putative membrane protein
MTTASNAKAVPFRHNRFLHVLCLLLMAIMIASGIRPVMPVDWWAENALVFVFIGVLAAIYRWLTFSQLSYLLMFFFLCLHEWGSHYRYAIDPIGEWIRQVFHTTRNDFDRVVHFSYGLFFAYPQRELLMRKARLGRGWAACLSVLIILAYSAGYEIIEAVAASLLGPGAGDAFLALQGDGWDTQKDMFLAFCGASVTMTVTAVLSRRQRRLTVVRDRRVAAAR